VELAHNDTRWIAEATPQLDYWITAGDTPAIMERYAEATGHSPMLPDWAAGFWQASLRYRNQDEVLAVAREYKERGLPLEVIVIDFFHWTVQGDWKFDPELWPDPSGMVRELEKLGVRVKVSVWPTVNALSANFDHMLQNGMLVRTARGVPAIMHFEDTRPPGRIYVHYYDPTHPEARQFMWDQVRAGYYQHGIKVWWLDACEPEIKPADPDNLVFHLGPGLAVANIYPFLHQLAFYDGMRAEGETEIMTFCRSAWAGSQRYGAAVWSGDIWSTWEALRAQIPAGLNMGLSGIPWWTTDIGGPFGGNSDTPYFRELVVRWFQYSAFCPLFRLHGMREPLPQLELPPGQSQAQIMTGGPNNVWSFGEEAYAIIKDVMALRERLRPYLMDQMRAAHEKGTPPMRPLFFDFPNDTAAIDIEDQFMLGPDVLVAPILYPGATSRSVYLPAGVEWTDAWTGAKLAGGQRLEADAPLDRIPVYLRADAQVPIYAAR
jgi:alpha-D-xyloside xylohydrolase